MSDFDKEAEREKLREQFAADEEKREVTERMSNLLLQGATMTNTHCDTCSSPIFTYEGQAFCPTCQVEVDDAGGEGATAGATEPEVDPADADRPDSTAGPEAGADSSTRIEVSDPGTSTDPQSSTPTESNASPEPSEPEPTRERRRPSPSEPTGASDTTATPSPRAESDSTAEPARGRTSSAADTSTGDSDLTAAQASLSRTLTRLSEEAERSDDLSRTREHLLAAREAAEALAALREARR